MRERVLYATAFGLSAATAALIAYAAWQMLAPEPSGSLADAARPAVASQPQRDERPLQPEEQPPPTEQQFQRAEVAVADAEAISEAVTETVFPAAAAAKPPLAVDIADDVAKRGEDEHADRSEEHPLLTASTAPSSAGAPLAASDAIAVRPAERVAEPQPPQINERAEAAGPAAPKAQMARRHREAAPKPRKHASSARSARRGAWRRGGGGWRSVRLWRPVRPHPHVYPRIGPPGPGVIIVEPE